MEWILFSIAFVFVAGLSLNHWSFLAWLFMAGASAFRFNIGPDYFQYVTIHDWILTSDAPFDISEPFHVLVTFLADSFGFNYQFVIFIYALLTSMFFFLGFKYFCKGKVHFLLLTIFYFSLLYLSSLNTIRMYLAAAIFLYSARFIIEKKFVIYGLLCLVAFFAHKSAILLLPLYFVGGLRLSKALTISIILTLFLMAISGVGLGKIVIHSISFIGLDYTSYLSYGRFSEGVTVYSLFMSMLVVILFSLLSFVKVDDRLLRLSFNFLFLMVVVRMLALDLRILSRFDLYFKPFLIIFIATLIWNYISKLNIRERWLVVYPFCLLIGAVFVLQSFYVGRSESAYNHYTMNIGVFSNKPNLVEVFGDYKKADSWQK